jgi:hypothetical protein
MQNYRPSHALVFSKPAALSPQRRWARIGCRVAEYYLGRE